MADAVEKEGGSPCSVDFGDGDELSPPPADTDDEPGVSHGGGSENIREPS